MAASSTDCLGGVPEGSFFSGPPQEESAALRRAVLDLGTGSLKVGWAGERRPRHVLATCSGAVRRRPQLFVSDECLLLPEYICSRPASGGLWTDLDVLREVIDLSLSKRFLAADPETLAVALTQPILAPAATRRQLCEVFFEDFGIQRLAVCAAQALVPYAFWGFDGSGEDVTAPVKSSKQSLHLQKMKVHCYSGEEDGAGECGDPCLLSAPLSPARSSSRQRLSASFPEREVAREELASCGLSWVDARRNPFSLVVDCGFSCSHAVPCSGYTTMDGAALRSEVGGANANAYLKNLLAARGVCLEKKELFVQKVKEEVCFVVPDLPSALRGLQKEALKRGLPLSAAGTPLEIWRPLPDYSQTKAQLLSFFHTHSPAPLPDLKSPVFRDISTSDVADAGGCVDTAGKDQEVAEACAVPGERGAENPENSESQKSNLGLRQKASVRLAAERILVPEVFFRPQDAESSECGIPELICRAIAKAPVEAQPFLASQIFLTGGSAKFPGFVERLWRDLRESLPQEWPVNIYRHEDPQFSAWLGASVWAERDAAFLPFSITKQQFFEEGFF